MHNATLDLQLGMRKMKRAYRDYYILKMDIRKYFNSIDKKILYKILTRRIKDEKLLWLIRQILTAQKRQKGIEIGNYTSQTFANIYLNELDQFAKRTLKLKYYTRYMDDFVILLKSKKECIEVKAKIEAFLNKTLHLTLNEKSRYYPYSMGVNFCGYRIFTTHKLLRTNSKKKIKKNVKSWNKAYKANSLDIPLTLQKINSWIGHASHCNSYNLEQKVLNSCNFLYTDHTYNKIEQNLLEDISLITNNK